MKSLLFAIVLLLALTGGAIAIAQATYSATDPRWTDADTTNDPNTCFEAGATCRTQEDWDNGWKEARCLAGLWPCGDRLSDRQQPSSSQRRSSSQQTSSSSTSTTTNFRQVSSSGRTLPPCPVGKVCVDHYPSGDHYVFEVDNCCYPSQAIYSVVH